MVLTREQRSKINKSNRARGYAVEYDSVKYLRKIGCWAMRLRSRQQVGEMSCIDGYFWNPLTLTFGFFQAKYQKKYLGKDERERIIELCTKYNAQGVFFWRDNGIKFEVLKH